MLIQKLRLQKGWSQQQLAQMSGLSTRTIQRIENGQQPSMESVKSLAAVFEVDFLTLNSNLQETEVSMTSVDSMANQNEKLVLTDDERVAFKTVKRIKKFYTNLAVYCLVIPILAVIDYITSPDFWWVQWVILGWGISIGVLALKAFARWPFFDAQWEKRQVEKQLNRKL